jgi:hypothetical protein
MIVKVSHDFNLKLGTYLKIVVKCGQIIFLHYQRLGFNILKSLLNGPLGECWRSLHVEV